MDVPSFWFQAVLKSRIQKVGTSISYLKKVVFLYLARDKHSFWVLLQPYYTGHVVLVIKCTPNYYLLLELDGLPEVVVSSHFEILGLETRDVHLFLCKKLFLFYVAREEL